MSTPWKERTHDADAYRPVRELDRLTQQLFGTNGTPSRPAVMPMDAYRAGEQFVVHFDLPGVDPSSIDLDVERNVLTVKAQHTPTYGEDVELQVAELIHLAITTRIKPITDLSTVAMSVGPVDFQEDGDIRAISPVRPIDETYANGYANSKWAGEVLLREAHDLCGLPVAVFRSDMILAHTRYIGQLNVPDAFTRLIFSLLVTGITPRSFHETDAQENRSRAHYDGLPADFVAESITTLGEQATEGFCSFDVINSYDDGVSLDTFIDWLTDAGHKIQRIDDYKDWLARFETALRALPEKQRQQTVLPLLNAYQKPEKPLGGASALTEVFHAAVRTAKIGAEELPCAGRAY